MGLGLSRLRPRQLPILHRSARSIVAHYSAKPRTLGETHRAFPCTSINNEARLLQRNYDARLRLNPAHACLKRDIARAETRRNGQINLVQAGPG